MMRCFAKSAKKQTGFSILEMLLATVILLVGLVAIAQLVPASVLLNYRNRSDSSALIFAQKELDQMLAQPINPPSPWFTDPYTGNTCYLGDPTKPNQLVGTNVLAGLNGTPIIDFNSSVANYNFTYQDPTDPSGTTYDVRWAVITMGNGSTASAKRFILGIRQTGGNGYFQPITLDAMVSK